VSSVEESATENVFIWSVFCDGVLEEVAENIVCGVTVYMFKFIITLILITQMY
jgi:hypothetical protein